MPEDLVRLLGRFHREVLLPDVKQVVAEAVEASERRLRDEMHAGFATVSRQLADLRQEQVRSLTPMVPQRDARR